MKILFCGITDQRQECSIDFAIMVLQLPFAFAFERLHVVYAKHPKDIFAEFIKSDFDVLMCCPSNRASMPFIQRALTKPSNDQPEPIKNLRVIVGCEPVPIINWEDVTNGKPATLFNIRQEQVKKHTKKKEGYVQMKRVYDFIHTFPDIFMYHKPFDAKKDNAWLDYQTPFTSTNKVEFAGCVKYRFLTSHTAPQSEKGMV